jgi:hypothetical protein
LEKGCEEGIGIGIGKSRDVVARQMIESVPFPKKWRGSDYLQPLLNNNDMKQINALHDRWADLKEPIRWHMLPSAIDDSISQSRCQRSPGGDPAGGCGRL